MRFSIWLCVLRGDLQETFRLRSLFFAVASGRYTDVFQKTAIELRERLVAHVEGDFSHPCPRIEELALGPFDTAPVDVLRQGHASGFLENLAEIIVADSDVMGNFIQVDFVFQAGIDELSGPGDDVRFGTVLLDQQAVEQVGQLKGKGGQHGDGSLIL